jgi:glucokinase
MEGEIVAGVDIGGTNSVVGLVDKSGTILLKERFSTLAHDPPQEFVPRLVAVITTLLARLPAGSRLGGIVLASPAANARQGIIDNPANFKWGRVDLIAMIRRMLDVPTALINDGDAAVLGEMRFGVASGLSNVLLLTLGTGVGAGMVMDGKLIQGASGAGTEFGHVSIDPKGRDCGCGKRGCAETYVSASGVRRTVFELLSHRLEPTFLRDISFNDLTTEIISRLAVEGDPIAVEAFEQTGAYLGHILANAVAIFDPEAVVLSGGLVNAGDILMSPVRRSFEEHVLERYRGSVRLLTSTLNDGEAAILGAASIAWEMTIAASVRA